VLRESHGKPVNFGEVAQLFTLDVLSKVAFGKCFGTLSARKDIFGYGKASEDFLPISELMSNHAFFRMLFGNPLMQKIAAPKDTDEVGLGRVVKFARGRVEERFKNAGKIVDEGGQDMISHFMAKGLDQLQCEAEANLQILAGSDSTTTVLRCTLYLLAGSPVCYGRLRAEVDRAIADGAVSHPVVTYAETEDLAYLRACIWEGMRMVCEP
jgi:cytochrome P450